MKVWNLLWVFFGSAAIVGVLIIMLYLSGLFSGDRPVDVSSNGGSYLFDAGAARIPIGTPNTGSSTLNQVPPI
jgi:hypothetical protein